ncbi:glycosyl hydrolase family 30 TIM-barrel domain-containing protein [Ditylenchus destructor]|nr:glycosyl hydrolase family 30 TIM-barrel domain-containing protein [Ditylenchus destructor]
MLHRFFAVVLLFVEILGIFADTSGQTDTMNENSLTIQSDDPNTAGCHKRFYKPSQTDKKAEDSFVCVCNGTYNDEVEPVGTLGEQQVVYYTSSKEEHRLKRDTTQFTPGQQQTDLDLNVASAESVTIKVDGSKTYQEIFGFGGAFTDAAGIQFKALSEGSLQKLLESYFGERGINYTVGRVPIASTDFSTREYSYLEKEDDFDLESFALAQEDLDLKIPYIRKALELSDKLQFFASPWAAPAWMKTNGHMKGGGQLKGEFNGKYYETYAKYFVKFLEEYNKHGINYWGLTIENEPGAGAIPDYAWQAMYLSPKMQRDFAYYLLSPALKASEVGKNIKLMAHDDQRDQLLKAAEDIYDDQEKSSAIDGLGVHWYSQSPFDVLSKVHDIKPDKFILSTEACTGYNEGEHIPLLGDWHRAEQYAVDILQSLRNWVVGWIDWNLALDMQGGPNWVGNNVDAPILVNATADEFLKQPIFYALAHFSTFVLPGSVRVDSISEGGSDESSLQHVAFRTSEGRRVLVLLNTHPNQTFTVQVQDVKISGSAHISLPAKSFVTVLWAKPEDE